MTSNNKREIGDKYEALAKEYLLSQGLSFIDNNFSIRGGEIDLIMQDKHTYVFVEVKYRTSQYYGHSAEMVTYAKQQRLIKTAFVWLQQHQGSVEESAFRFDIIAIHQKGNDIQWIKNAITQG